MKRINFIEGGSDDFFKKIKGNPVNPEKSPNLIFDKKNVKGAKKIKLSNTSANVNLNTEVKNLKKRTLDGREVIHEGKNSFVLNEQGHRENVVPVATPRGNEYLLEKNIPARTNLPKDVKLKYVNPTGFKGETFAVANYDGQSIALPSENTKSVDKDWNASEDIANILQKAFIEILNKNQKGQSFEYKNNSYSYESDGNIKKLYSYNSDGKPVVVGYTYTDKSGEKRNIIYEDFGNTNISKSRIGYELKDDKLVRIITENGVNSKGVAQKRISRTKNGKTIVEDNTTDKNGDVTHTTSRNYDENGVQEKREETDYKRNEKGQVVDENTKSYNKDDEYEGQTHTIYAYDPNTNNLASETTTVFDANNTMQKQIDTTYDPETENISSQKTTLFDDTGKITEETESLYNSETGKLDSETTTRFDKQGEIQERIETKYTYDPQTGELKNKEFKNFDKTGKLIEQGRTDFEYNPQTKELRRGITMRFRPDGQPKERIETKFGENGRIIKVSRSNPEFNKVIDKIKSGKMPPSEITEFLRNGVNKVKISKDNGEEKVDNLFFLMRSYESKTGESLLETLAKLPQGKELCKNIIKEIKTHHAAEPINDISADMNSHPEDFKKLSVDIERIMLRAGTNTPESKPLNNITTSIKPRVSNKTVETPPEQNIYEENAAETQAEITEDKTISVKYTNTNKNVKINTGNMSAPTGIAVANTAFDTSVNNTLIEAQTANPANFHLNNNKELVSSIKSLMSVPEGLKTLRSMWEENSDGIIEFTTKDNETYVITKDQVQQANYIPTNNFEIRVYAIALDRYSRDAAYKGQNAKADNISANNNTLEEISKVFFGNSGNHIAKAAAAAVQNGAGDKNIHAGNVQPNHSTTISRGEISAPTSKGNTGGDNGGGGNAGQGSSQDGGNNQNNNGQSSHNGQNGESNPNGHRGNQQQRKKPERLDENDSQE